MVRRAAWVGTGAVVLPGPEIGENTMTGVGAVVTRDVWPNAVVDGSPARVVRSIC